jgi:hypothetical protein
MEPPFSPESFVINYPEFEPLLREGQRIQTANRLAKVAGLGWLGFDNECAQAVAHELLVAHILTVLVDGAAPVAEYETKESKEKLDTKLRSKPAETLSLHTTDYGTLLLDLVYMDYTSAWC